MRRARGRARLLKVRAGMFRRATEAALSDFYDSVWAGHASFRDADRTFANDVRQHLIEISAKQLAHRIFQSGKLPTLVDS